MLVLKEVLPRLRLRCAAAASVAVLAMAAAGAPGCGGRPQTPPEVPARLVATFRVEPRTFNRVVAIDPAQFLLTSLLHATLLRVDRATGRLEPRLARDWTTSPDGRSVTFRLRDASFSDGAPVTADDVAFTFRAIYDPRVGSPLASALEIDGRPLSVTVVGPRTVRIDFPSPFGPGLTVFDSVPILPRHKLGPALEAGTFSGAWSLKTPVAELVGAGPFVLAEYVPGQRLRFRRNAQFFARPLPRLDEIEIQIVPEQNAEMLRLEAGQSDLVADFARAEDLGRLRQAAAQGRVQLTDAGVDISPETLWFNLAPGAPRAKDRPWLQREELRKAISHGVDRQAIVDTVFLGAGVRIYGPITPGHREWYVPDLPATPFDRAKARALLASIGLSDRNGDGALEDSRGRPARFSIMTTKGNAEREQVVAMLQNQLRQIGLTIDVVTPETRQVIAQWTAGEYDAIYYGPQFDAIDPARNLEYWMSSGSFHFWHPQQKTPSTPWEAEIDRLMRQQSTSVDPAERRRLFRRVQEIFLEHLPTVYFAAPKATVPMSPRVRGAIPSILPPPVLWNPEVLSIAGGR